MIKAKNKKVAKVQRINVYLTNFSGGINTNIDEHVLPFKTAKMAYNFKFDAGVLTDGTSLNTAMLPNANYGTSDEETETIKFKLPTGFFPARGYHYTFCDPANEYKRSDKIVMVGTNKLIKHWTINNSLGGAVDTTPRTLLLDLPFDAVNYRLNGEDVMIFTYKDKPMQVYNAGGETLLTTIDTAPNILSMCVHYERLFAVVADNRDAIWFSEELDPTAWNVDLSGAGFIEMVDDRGQLTKVISFNGYVYIFREFGIARLTAYADQTSFSLNQLFTSSGRIYEDTITICGNRILFLASDGLYSFDGINATKLTMGIETMFTSDFSSAVGGYYQGKYYLACRLNYNDNVKVIAEKASAHINNSLIEIDLKTGTLSVYRGMDIASFVSVKASDFYAMLCLFANYTKTQIGMIAERGGMMLTYKSPKSWQTPYTNFGYAGREKVLRQIKIRSEYPATITITTDKEKRVINLNASAKTQTIRTAIKGELFKVEFSTAEALAHISNPMFTLDVLQE